MPTILQPQRRESGLDKFLKVVQGVGGVANVANTGLDVYNKFKTNPLERRLLELQVNAYPEEQARKKLEEENRSKLVEAQLKDLENKPKENALNRAAEAAKNANKPTKAQETIDTEFGKEYSQYVLGGGRANVEKDSAILKDVIGQLKTRDDLTGPYAGKAVALSGLGGSLVAPDAIAAADNVRGVVQGQLKQVLGAQFTEREGENVLKRIYNPNLQEDENAKRLERFLTAMDKARQAKEDAIAYYEENGTMIGYKGRRYGLADIISEVESGGSQQKQQQKKGANPDFSKMSDEELKAIIGK